MQDALEHPEQELLLLDDDEVEEALESRFDFLCLPSESLEAIFDRFRF